MSNFSTSTNWNPFGVGSQTITISRGPSDNTDVRTVTITSGATNTVHRVPTQRFANNKALRCRLNRYLIAHGKKPLPQNTPRSQLVDMARAHLPVDDRQ